MTATASNASNLPIEHRRGLPELENIIARGLGTFIDVGHALLEIQERRLYLRAGYRSFAVYVEERWDISETHAYRQIEAARVIDILTPMESTLPANEAQARELFPLVSDPDAVRLVWRETVAESGARITARAIRARVARVAPKATRRGRGGPAVENTCPACGHRWA